MKAPFAHSHDNMHQTSSSDAVRLVVAGFATRRGLWAAHRELRNLGLREDQLCVFGLDEALGRLSNLLPTRLSHARKAAGLNLKVYAVHLFDDIGLAEVSSTDHGPAWMPSSQAETLWHHVRQGRSVMLVKTGSPDQQVISSRIQLRHEPTFVHTFNFCR